MALAGHRLFAGAALGGGAGEWTSAGPGAACGQCDSACIKGGLYLLSLRTVASKAAAGSTGGAGEGS
jgi:hypothetical protein